MSFDQKHPVEPSSSACPYWIAPSDRGKELLQTQDLSFFVLRLRAEPELAGVAMAGSAGRLTSAGEPCQTDERLSKGWDGAYGHSPPPQLCVTACDSISRTA